jgi:hypothetical protein
MMGVSSSRPSLPLLMYFWATVKQPSRSLVDAPAPIHTNTCTHNGIATIAAGNAS